MVLSWKRPSPGRIFTQWMWAEAWALSYLQIRRWEKEDPSDLVPFNSQEKGERDRLSNGRAVGC